jgi:hypothetical protein
MKLIFATILAIYGAAVVNAAVCKQNQMKCQGANVLICDADGNFQPVETCFEEGGLCCVEGGGIAQCNSCPR